MSSEKAKQYFFEYGSIINDTMKAYGFIPGKLLGNGGYGRVYSCFSNKYSQEFALKVLPIRLKKSIIESFNQEVQILTELDHPYIIKIYYQFKDPYFAYLVMELCDGGSLLDKINKKKFLSASEILSITQQLVIAINYCHSHDIAHNEISTALPSNHIKGNSSHKKADNTVCYEIKESNAYISFFYLI